MPKKQFRTKFLILTLLREQPQTGYEISQKLKKIGWVVSHQQIYQDCNLMADSEELTFEVSKQDGKPDKKIYSLSEKGFQVYQQLLNCEPKIPPLRDELMMQAIAGNLSYLQQYRLKLNEEIDQLLENFSEKTASYENNDLIRNGSTLMYNRQIDLLSADINWIDGVIADLKTNIHTQVN